MASAFTELVIDCSDPKRVAGLGAEVLGYRMTEDFPSSDPPAW